MWRFEIVGYPLFQRGDVNAFFSLMLDNITNLVIFSMLLATFGFPKEIVYGGMIPGTALGILVGNLMFSYLALRLSKKTGNLNVTAMPLGIDTVSLFGYTLGILVPVWTATGDAVFTWQVGVATIVLTGLIKTIFSLSSGWIKKLFPSAALLGSIAGIALLLIAFIPSMAVFESPIVGMVSMGIIFVFFFGRKREFLGVPGALWAVAAGTAVYYFLLHIDPSISGSHLSGAIYPGLHVPMPVIAPLGAYASAVDYASLIIPFSIANVVGGIDVTESAEAAGDAYDVRSIIFTEGVTTILAGLFGGVLQTTPYIGHPAYKKMGGRVGYSILNGLVVGTCGMFGVFSLIANYLPQQVISPILIFIGIEITAQAFQRSPQHHSAAVAISFIPSVAYLLSITIDQLGIDLRSLSTKAISSIATINLLANGFIVTAMIWGAALASLIDEKPQKVSLFLSLGAIFSLFGLMHSPLEHGALFLPWSINDKTPIYIASAYALLSLLVISSGKGSKEG
jgi:AGZA family xanthine/uracil permease-like MFS transporter